MKLGERLRLLRTSRHLTQNHVARATRLSSSLMSLYETGRRVPTLYQLNKFARFYEMRISELLAPVELDGHDDAPLPFDEIDEDPILTAELADIERRYEIGLLNGEHADLETRRAYDEARERGVGCL